MILSFTGFFITILTGVHLPPLQSLSETLHAATASKASISALKTILSPALDLGAPQKFFHLVIF